MKLPSLIMPSEPSSGSEFVIKRTQSLLIILRKESILKKRNFITESIESISYLIK